MGSGTSRPRTRSPAMASITTAALPPNVTIGAVGRTLAVRVFGRASHAGVDLSTGSVRP